MTALATRKTYTVYVRRKLFKTCKTEEEKNTVVRKLKRDTTLTDKDITVGLNILVSK